MEQELRLSCGMEWDSGTPLPFPYLTFSLPASLSPSSLSLPLPACLPLYLYSVCCLPSQHSSHLHSYLTFCYLSKTYLPPAYPLPP